MKNHIKNCIKIMGLAAVPFGTAQVHGDPTEYRIKVERKEGANGERYIVSFECLSGEYHRESKVIEIDWEKNGFPVRISPRFANSMVQVGDMKKTNEYINNRKEKSEVYLFPFKVRRLTLDNLDKKDNPIFADCFLVFIPKVFEGYERVVLFIKVWNRVSVRKLVGLNVISDVPVIFSSYRNIHICTNNLCPGRKIPDFTEEGCHSCFSEFTLHEGAICLVDPVNMPSGEELSVLKRSHSGLIVVKDGCLNLISSNTRDGRCYMLFDKDLDWFATKNYFSQETIKNGRASWKDFLDSEQQLLQKQTEFWSGYMGLRVHNENDFSIYFGFGIRELFLIEPHGVRSVMCGVGDYCSSWLNPYLEQPNDTWVDKVWIECPNGKSPKICYCIEDDVRVEHDLKRNKMIMIKNGKIVEEKEIGENKIKNEIKEEPKKKEKKKSKEPKEEKKQGEDKKEDKKSKEDPFEIKKEEDKKSNPFALTPPMEFMGGDD